MAKIISSLPGSIGILSRTSQLINDGESNVSTYVELDDLSIVATTGNYDNLRNNRKIEIENFMMAATFTRTKIKREDLPEGDEINMCEAMDRLFQRFENQGIEKGKREEKQNTLKEQLKVKLGTLSRPLEKIHR